MLQRRCLCVFAPDISNELANWRTGALSSRRKITRNLQRKILLSFRFVVLFPCTGTWFEYRRDGSLGWKKHDWKLICSRDRNIQMEEYQNYFFVFSIFRTSISTCPIDNSRSRWNSYDSRGQCQFGKIRERVRLCSSVDFRGIFRDIVTIRVR